MNTEKQKSPFVPESRLLCGLTIQTFEARNGELAARITKNSTGKYFDFVFHFFENLTVDDVLDGICSLLTETKRIGSISADSLIPDILHSTGIAPGATYASRIPFSRIVHQLIEIGMSPRDVDYLNMYRKAKTNV
jgi:hypothetical protein